MFASYGISVVLFIPPMILFGSTPAVQVGVILGHIVCSLLLLRYSRSVFIGIDYLLDPGEPQHPDGGVVILAVRLDGRQEYGHVIARGIHPENPAVLVCDTPSS